VAVPALQDYERRVAQEGIETRTSWIVAGVVLFILTFSYGAPLLAVVALKPIAADLGNARSVPALANSLAWLGSGAGAIGFGWIAERFGVARTVLFGAVMMGAGLAFASIGGSWELLVGHGLLVGILGGGAINVPLIIYISRWFVRLRGSAVALVSSGIHRRAVAALHWAGDRALRMACDHVCIRHRHDGSDRSRSADAFPTRA
jgi:MFS family permease